jgi:hypothetical protein
MVCMYMREALVFSSVYIFKKIMNFEVKVKYKGGGPKD